MTALPAAGWPEPEQGWPHWLATVPYAASQHPLAREPLPIAQGANCQRYAYAVLAAFGRQVPPHRSSELWAEDLEHPAAAQPFDLALFNADDESWGAHVAVVMGDDELLHLCAEEGRPVVWRWADFASRERYRTLVGLVRPAAARVP